MKHAFYKFLSDDSGLTTVEYAVAGALVSLAVVAAFTLLGGAIGDTIDLLTAAVTPAP